MAVKTTPRMAALIATLFSLPVAADENLLGYVSGAETLPKGAARPIYS